MVIDEKKYSLKDNTHWPKISLITPTFNQGNFLEATIQSIISQQYPNLEYIIIDGGSSDNSIDIIQKYVAYISYWISEPDSGQSDAINKGIALATGEIFNWVNSDDLLAPGTLLRVAQEFILHPELNVVCGYYHLYLNEKSTKKRRMEIFSDIEKTLIYGNVSPCSTFYRLSVFKSLGPLHVKLHYCFDLEIWYRYLEKYGLNNFRFIKDNLAFFRLHKDSKSVSNQKKFFQDHFNLQHSLSLSFPALPASLLPAAHLHIPLYFQRIWQFPFPIQTKKLAAYMIQHQLEMFYTSFSFTENMRFWLRSFLFHPSNRGWRFYLLPVRYVKWQFKNSEI